MSQGEHSKDQDDFQYTPTKNSQGDDGHIDTPRKRKLDFWGTSTDTELSVDEELAKIDEKDLPSTSSKKPKIILKIQELVEGQCLMSPLKVRVSYKSHKRSRICGTMFNFHCMDGSGEISVVGFPQVVEAFYDKIEVNNVYTLEDFVVQKESTKYPSGTGNQLEIKISLDTQISDAEEDQNDPIPPINFTLLSIDDIQKMGPNRQVDFVFILVKVNKPETTRNGHLKRDIEVTDQSKLTMRVTLWGSDAENFDTEVFSVIACRRGNTAVYNSQVSVNCTNTLLWVNPPLDEAKGLEEWFHKELKKKKMN